MPGPIAKAVIAAINTGEQYFVDPDAWKLAIMPTRLRAAMYANLTVLNSAMRDSIIFERTKEQRAMRIRLDTYNG